MRSTQQIIDQNGLPLTTFPTALVLIGALLHGSPELASGIFRNENNFYTLVITKLHLNDGDVVLENGSVALWTCGGLINCFAHTHHPHRESGHSHRPKAQQFFFDYKLFFCSTQHIHFNYASIFGNTAINYRGALSFFYLVFSRPRPHKYRILLTKRTRENFFYKWPKWWTGGVLFCCDWCIAVRNREGCVLTAVILA